MGTEYEPSLLPEPDESHELGEYVVGPDGELEKPLVVHVVGRLTNISLENGDSSNPNSTSPLTRDDCEKNNGVPFKIFKKMLFLSKKCHFQVKKVKFWGKKFFF